MKESPQEFTSANTSKNTINSIYKVIDFAPNSTILDYGAGKYDSNKNFILSQNKNITFLKYDKYNLSKKENYESINRCLNNAPDYIICSNVLNVIKEDSIIEEIVENIYNIADMNTLVVFEVYERNKSCIACPTIVGFQRNQPAEFYKKFLENFSVKKIKNYLYCKKI